MDLLDSFNCVYSVMKEETGFDHQWNPVAGMSDTKWKFAIIQTPDMKDIVHLCAGGWIGLSDEIQPPCRESFLSTVGRNIGLLDGI